MQPKPLHLMDHREFPVLYVDDERDNLRIFELTFRKQFSILTAPTPEEGLRMLHENPVAVILSDYRMPGMNGVEFLSQAREIDGRCIRMLVTAYGDAEILGEAINDGRIYQYIPKPWEPGDMGLTVRRAIEAYAIERERAALLHELMLINRLSQTLHRELDLEKLVERVLGALYGELEFDGGAVGLLDQDGDQVTWLGVVPTDEVADRVREVVINESNAPHFLEQLKTGTPQTLRIADMSDLESPLQKWVTEVSADEVLVVPLVGESQVIGFLAVDQRSGSKRFGADERTILDGLATQAVIAIENARLVEALRNSREQVKRADRLGTLGTLAAGLAHEINNPLVSLRTFLTLAPNKRQDEDPEFWGGYYQLACAELERIRGLVATMSNLARGGLDEVVWERVELGELAERVVTLMQGEAREAEIELDLVFSDNMLPVWGVRDHLHQAMLNLLYNAVQASPPGSRIQMELHPDRDHPRDLMCFSVSDEGPGIPAENIERIFDPFFTTKGPDQGTGLGLMITHQIVADHGGSIEVRSDRGQGAAFKVKLPVKGVPGR